MRCDVDGASGHVTMKPSICIGSAFYKSSACAVKVSCLTPGGLPGAPETALSVEQSTLTAGEKSAEGIVGGWRRRRPER